LTALLLSWRYYCYGAIFDDAIIAAPFLTALFLTALLLSWRYYCYGAIFDGAIIAAPFLPALLLRRYFDGKPFLHPILSVHHLFST
jgi:hypothetical protein